MPEHRTIVVFLKYPTAGKVKSRLGKTIGFEEAARVYRQLVARVLETVDQSSKEEVVICYDPPEAETQTREWLGEIAKDWTFLPQAKGDLGERLLTGVAAAFGSGATQVAVIGSDCVEIGAETFRDAWAAVGAREPAVVFGPTHDGGYYLVGLNQPCPDIFTYIPWSTEITLEASIAAAESAGFSVNQLTQLSDIDDESDWREAQRRGTLGP